MWTRYDTSCLAKRRLLASTRCWPPTLWPPAVQARKRGVARGGPAALSGQPARSGVRRRRRGDASRP
eukprot:365182-Chlamydomonas_euryale.AAC.7